MNRIHTGPEAEAGLVRTAPVTDLVARAANGEKRAWDALVERYSPLIWSICLGTGWATPTPTPWACVSGGSSCTGWMKFRILAR